MGAYGPTGSVKSMVSRRVWAPMGANSPLPLERKKFNSPQKFLSTPLHRNLIQECKSDFKTGKHNTQPV